MARYKDLESEKHGTFDDLLFHYILQQKDTAVASSTFMY